MKKLLLALTISTATLTATAAPAFACGSYADLDPNLVAIRRAIYASPALRRDVWMDVSAIELADATHAEAHVTYFDREGRPIDEADVRLVRRVDTWRVVG
ncbi:MAG: hypothetical protein AB7S26_00270 [Sandaracinaceae bacterium]